MTLESIYGKFPRKLMVCTVVNNALNFSVLLDLQVLEYLESVWGFPPKDDSGDISYSLKVIKL